MRKKTYNILSKIPIVGIVAKVICKPVMFCSMGLDQGTYDKLLDFQKKHSDLLITEKIANSIK